jgi:glycosyltransferase involved in cell wall biosynthesis
MPSFAEGYGLPVAEALSAGTPVLCSDLASLREVGQQVPEYLDPLDGPAWQRAIVDYSEPDSPRRRAQLDRLAVWRAPSWDAHFAIVDGLIERICGSTK